MTHSIDETFSHLSDLLDSLSPAPRLKIILALGSGESCVCHLEGKLGLRQAYLSQHLMALRKARLIKTRREGRYIFYSLADPMLLDLIRLAAKLAGVSVETAVKGSRSGQTSCRCPVCTPAAAHSTKP